jgi:two-component system nitrogen regulation response regulator GlnG
MGDIIIIDDDADDSFILKSLFEKIIFNKNYLNKVITITDSRTVISYLDSNAQKPSLIISDIRMPGIDGYELGQLITEYQESNSIYFPYVFLTTYVNDKEFNRQSENSRFKVYYIKPYDYDEYVKLVESIVDQFLT